MLISFWLFVGAIAVHGYLLLRFVRQLTRSKLLSPEKTEALGQLMVSGSGGVRDQWRALRYLLGRKYSTLGDESMVKSGDYARKSFFVAFVFMVGWGLAAMLAK